MIKRPDGDRLRLVTQPDHAELSGYLAAHWGNDAFRPLGAWEESPDPDALRREIVFGVAEHDNGWWEWEADPRLDPADGLPIDFLEDSDEAGFARWNRGAARFELSRPFASLLISRHAYWLQAARVAPISEPQFRHPLFGFHPHLSDPQSSEAAALREFLIERLTHERALLDRLALHGRLWAEAVRDATLLPAVRALQVLDTLSLALCGVIAEPLQLVEVPRQSWDDRVALDVLPASPSRITLDPYPFDQTPLPVVIPALLVAPRAWQAAQPKSLLEFELASPA